jgi:hypothetical protein
MSRQEGTGYQLACQHCISVIGSVCRQAPQGVADSRRCGLTRQPALMKTAYGPRPTLHTDDKLQQRQCGERTPVNSREVL